MDVKVKAYDKVLLLTVTGTVSAEDILTLDQELPGLYQAFGLLVFSFKKAEVIEGIFSMLGKIRDKHAMKKTRLMFVSPKTPGADFKTIEAALESQNTSDALRVVNILKASADLRIKKKELDAVRLQHSNALRYGLGEKEGTEPLTAEEAEKYIFRLKEAMRRLQYLHKVIGGEIASIQKESKTSGATAPAPDAVARVTSIQNEAIKALKQAGAV